MARSSQATTALYVSPKFLRRMRWLVILPGLLSVPVTAALLLLATRGADLARPLRRVPFFVPDGTTALQVMVATMALSVLLCGAVVLAMRAQARAWRARPFLTITPQGLDLMRGGFVPWEEIAAVIAPERSAFAPAFVHLVVRPGFAQRRAAAAGKTGLAAWWDAFSTPVMTHRGFGAPTLALHSAAIDLRPEELAAILERHRVTAAFAALPAEEPLAVR